MRGFTLLGIFTVLLNFVNFSISVAYAQSLPALPTWVHDPPSDPYYFYFVGEGSASSLKKAEELSFQDASNVIVDYLIFLIQSSEESIGFPINDEILLSESVTSSTVSRTYFTYDPSSEDSYRHFTLLKLAKKLLETDLEFFAIDRNLDHSEVLKFKSTLERSESPTDYYYKAYKSFTDKEELRSLRRSIEIKNTSRPLGKKFWVGKKSWEWTIFLSLPPNEDILSKINLVTYKLHPTFHQPIVPVPPDRAKDKFDKAFAHTAKGWGTFVVNVLVSFNDGRKIYKTHQLRFKQ